MEGLSYIPALLAAFDAGHAGRDIHLGLDATDQLKGAGTVLPPGDDPAAELITAQARMTDLHLAALDAHSGQRIADLGCGIGGAIARLDARLACAELLGFNIDPRQLARARSFAGRGTNRITWYEGCVSETLGTELCLDRALSIEAMFHFPDPPRFLARLAGALQPGGRAVISTILFDPQTDPAVVRARQAVTHGFAPWPSPELSLADIEALSRAAGLQVEEVVHLEDRLHLTLALLVPEPPKEPTSHPVMEMRRLLAMGAIRYPMLTLTKTGRPGG